jgi:uncharacterized protein YjiK
MYSFSRIVVAALLVSVIAFTITNPLEDQPVAIYTSSGERFPATKVILFPHLVETSSLTYDDSSGTFYTTIDKGKPHIIQFRLDREKVQIVRTDTIIGLKRNYDFEGIEIVDRPGQPRYLQISTERYRRSDSIVNPAVKLSDLTYLPELSFAVKPDGMDENNNFEAVTLDPVNDLVILGKERQPYALYGRKEGEPAFRIFTESEFAVPYERFVDSVLGAVLPADRLAILKQVSFSGMAFDHTTGKVLVLNRYGRAVISVRLIYNSSYHWQVVDIWPYDGIDDASAEGVTPAMLVYGLAEGMAVWSEQGKRQVAIITDPGVGGRPTLYVFPYPRK